MNEPTFYPELIRIDITSKCNLKCKHCQTGMFREPGSELSDLSTKELQALFAQMSELGTKQVGFLGGEPLLRRDFTQLIKSLHDYNIRASITTNGWMINERLAQMLVNEIPTDVAVSIDGPSRATHDWLRGKGSFDRAVNALRLLVRHRGPSKAVLIGISAVIHQRNLHEAEAFLDLADRVGVDYLILAAVHPVGTAVSNWADLGISQDQIISASRKVLDRYLSNRYEFELRLNFLTPALRHMLVEEGYLISVSVPYYDRAGLYECYIQSDGRVFPSQRLSEMVPDALSLASLRHGLDFSETSIREKSLRDIWFGPAFESYRSLVLSKKHVAAYKSCSRCSFADTSCFPTAVPYIEGKPHAQEVCAHLYSNRLGPFVKVKDLV